MYTFLIACIPLLLLIIVAANGSYSWTSFIPPVVFGLTVGIIWAFVKKFFIFQTFIWTESTSASMVHIFFTETILPIVLCTVIFLIFSRDKAVYKSEALAPMLAACYAVIVPFTVISGPDKTATFMLFAKPLLYSGMFILLSLFASLATACISRKKIIPAIPLYILAVIQLPLPAYIETRWYYTMAESCTTYSIIYAVTAVILYVIIKTAAALAGQKSRSEPSENPS